MADEYAHPLLVEFEEKDIPRLKNKLTKYFLSKKSNGGDCEVNYENGSKTAVVRFREKEVQQNVLAKETHQISLDKGVLKVTVRLPSEEKTTQEDPSDKSSKKSDATVTKKQSAADEQKPTEKVQAKAKDEDNATADEELCSASAVIEDLPESMNQEFLEMLVDNILKDVDSSTASQFTLEVIPDISCGVVTFQNGKDNTDFIAKCPQNARFIKMKLSVRPLEATKQVMVENIPNCSADMIQLYFENEGGAIEDFRHNEDEQSAVIKFTNHQAVRKVMQKKHLIKKEEVKVYPFYKSLGVALYRKDKPLPKLPAAVSEPTNVAVLRYLTNNKAAAETVRCDLAKYFCNITLDQSAVRLSPMSSLLKEKNAKAMIKEWADTMKTAFAKALSKFKSLEFSVESEVWKECEEKIKQRLEKEDVAVVPDKARGVLTVAGPVADVKRLEKPISEVLNKIQQRVHREKLSKTQEIKLLPTIFHILSKDGIQDKLLRMCPELKVSYDITKKALKVTGFVDEIINASKVISDATFALKRQTLGVDTYLFNMLKDEQEEELTDTLLTMHNINAALEISPQRVELVAVSDDVLNAAQDHLKQLLISQYIDVDDTEVLRMPEWLHLVSQLENANSNSGRRTRIHTTHKQVVVSGHKDDVLKVSMKLGDFLTDNAHVDETVDVQSDVIIEYLENHTSLLNLLEDCVTVSNEKEAIILSGPRAAVKTSKTIVEDSVSSVSFDSFKLSKPGVKKFFKDKESMVVTLVKSQTGCLVHLVDEETDDFAFVQQQKPVYQVQTADGVEIAVSKADMCSYPVDAIVSSSDEDLTFKGGLAGALLKAAGPQLQDECNKIISMKGKLKPTDCVITDAGGRLCCKRIIHAVAPHYDKLKPQKAAAQLKKTVKECLEAAERDGCISVALPAISRNLDFPLNLCLVTIAKAVKEFCDEKYEDNTLKRIHVVDSDDNVVQVMDAVFKQEFGNPTVNVGLGLNVPKQIPPPKLPVIKPPQVKLPLPDPSLCRVKTKEGVDIVLKKGKIEAAKTEVIVNTVFNDLALNRGAVSNAILSVAGPNLQQLVTNQKSTGTPGDIIVTDSCKLNSKHVYHVVPPSWDKGQGAAEKTLGGIYTDCLDKAENAQMASITFPAIGTGNLGFPKALIASLMLDKIMDFSSQTQPKHLKKVVIILYPTDTQTIQEFSDEFMRKFPKASGGLNPTSTSGSTGRFSKVVSSSGMYETKMGNVTVQVESGDITKETTDVIVNSSNESFSLKSGVSKAILDAAGQIVEEECKTLGSQTNPGMIMTQPGNLNCKKILHLVGQTDPVKINTVVKEALEMCVKNSHTSVSFPAIGTGQGNVQAKQVADAMLDAVIDVLNQNTSSALTLVRIVIFQQPMLTDFYSSMQQREASDPKDKAGFWTNIGNKFKSFFISESPQKSQKDKAVVIEPVKANPVFFHICGDSQAKVDAAKQKIKDLICDEHNSISITDKAIANLSAADVQDIVDIQKKLSVMIRTDDKNVQATIIIEGLHKDVLEANRKIEKMLKKVRDEEELKKKVELAGTKAEWQFQQQGLTFQSFDAMTNYHLEHAFEQQLSSIKVTIKGQDYTVTMPKGPATDSKGNVLQIKRIDKLNDDVPEIWDIMPPGTTCLSVPIQAGTPEYTEVLNLFQATCNRTVIKIERIQNPALWKGLQIKKQELEIRNNHQNNEKCLFHGTCENTVPTINNAGFNRSYAGKNAACYGNGSYFAVKASYSAQDTYSRPNANGEKFMYLCRVLTGDFTVGQPNMIAPPAKGGTSIHMYDSVVDNASNPSMFVIFHDIQAYPEYLITFK